jgi:solute carrier family 25 carnitine/acylcarnitine transporter 20/29
MRFSFLLLVLPVSGFSQPPAAKTRSTRTFLVGPAAASVLAGSVAGAVGVGLAFPLDTLKTKAQVLSQQSRANGDVALNYNMVQTVSHVWKNEGVSGFFAGVKSTMLGQAFIKVSSL